MTNIPTFRDMLDTARKDGVYAMQKSVAEHIEKAINLDTFNGPVEVENPQQRMKRIKDDLEYQRAIFDKFMKEHEGKHWVKEVFVKNKDPRVHKEDDDEKQLNLYIDINSKLNDAYEAAKDHAIRHQGLNGPSE